MMRSPQSDAFPAGADGAVRPSGRGDRNGKVADGEGFSFKRKENHHGTDRRYIGKRAKAQIYISTLFILIKYEQKTSKTAHSADWRQMGKSGSHGIAYRFRRHRRIGADSRRGWHAAATRPEQRPAHPHPRSSPHVRKTRPKSTTR